MRIRDWSSDVCSSDLDQTLRQGVAFGGRERELLVGERRLDGLVAQIFAVFDDLPVRHQPFPYRRQLFQHPAVAVALDIAFGPHRGKRLLDSGKVAEQIVEAAVDRKSTRLNSSH